MKKQLMTGVLATAVLTTSALPAMAEDVGGGFDVSANVSIVTDYLWRGVSQSNGREAIQGGVDAVHASGLYAGTWLSSVGAWYNGSDYAALEQDLYVGYEVKVADDVSVDLRYTQYMYPDSSDLNFDELHAAVSAFGGELGADYADNNANGTNSSLHLYGSYSYTMPGDLALSITYGNFDLKDDILATGTSEYNYWSIGASKKLLGLKWGVSYNDTDLSGTECATFAGGITQSVDEARDACGEQIVLSVSKAL